MRKLILINKDKEKAVRIDPRISSGYKRYGDLPVLPGFPRNLAPGEKVAVDIDENDVEVLYCRSSRSEDWVGFTLYRIGLPKDKAEVVGNIWLHD